MTIINEKYKGKYKGASDFVGTVIEDNCIVKNEEQSKKKVYDIDALFNLARANHIDVTKFDTVENRAAVGRMRMTIGNMLRAVAKRRHSLNDVKGNVIAAPADFTAELGEPTENADGTLIHPKEIAAESDAAEPKASRRKKAA